MATKFYTINQLCEMWGLHRTTISDMIRKQKLSATLMAGQYRISEEQLQEYYDANTIRRKE